MRTAITAAGRERLINAALGLAGESGEFADAVKKQIYHPHCDVGAMELAMELGDILWYLALAADALGYDLEFIAAQNLDKLSKRYPAGFPGE